MPTPEEKNKYEEVIDAMMRDEVLKKTKPELKDILGRSFKNNLEKRQAILSVLDTDRQLFTTINRKIGDKPRIGTQDITDIVEMLREYVHVGETERKLYGEVMTPIPLVEQMLDQLPKEVWSDPKLKWLDPANGCGIFPAVIVQRLMKGLAKWEPDEEKRYAHIVEKMLYVCELQPKNTFLFLCAFDPKDKYAMNVFTGSFLSDDFDRHAAKLWNISKFDIILGNPPYNKGVDLHFLEKSLTSASQILIVHPSSWILDRKGNKRYQQAKAATRGRLKALWFFNGNPIFNIGLYVPCVVTHCLQHPSGAIDVRFFDETFTATIEDVTKFGKNWIPIVKPFFEQMQRFCHSQGSVWQHTLNRKSPIPKDGYFVQFAAVRGHVKQSKRSSDKEITEIDFYTIATRDDSCLGIRNPDLTRPGNPIPTFRFETEDEQHNFLNYTRTKFARFCLSLLKNNCDLSLGNMALIPWLDFTKPWTDEELYDFFDVKGTTRQFIETFIPEYYHEKAQTQLSD